MAEGPGYWMHETSGVLRPAVEAYLAGAVLTPEQIAALRAYLRQWIMSPVWDENPHATVGDQARLDRLRGAIERLTDRPAIERWLGDASIAALDPL